MTKPIFYETTHFPKTLILGINAPYNKAEDINSYFEEFVSLVKTNGTPFESALYIKLRDIDPSYFISKGKLEQIKQTVEKDEIEQVVFSESLTTQQARNLEDYLECTITDRTELILEIFEKTAHSAEGKAQVAIAKLQHQKSRLAGKGIHFSQQAGIKGLRGGFGETAKEKERRHIEQTIHKFKKQLEKMQKARETQRKRRLNAQIPHICLIGYTNTGKSTILNTLTKSDVLAENKLFATLDTKTSALFINGNNKGVLSDTVGFIQHLPHHLVEAFKSTLSELQYADLLVHVVDISDPNCPSHIQVVHEILDELDVHKEMVYVFNKKDKMQNIPALEQEALEQALSTYRPHLLTNAKSKEGLQELIQFLDNWQATADTKISNPEVQLL